MTEPTVTKSERIDKLVAYIEDEMEPLGREILAVMTADLRALISSWRERGEALKPFAALLKSFPDINRYSDESGELEPINVGMVRRARAALELKEPK